MNSRLLYRKNEGKLKADLSHLAQSYANSFKPSLKDIEDIKGHKILNQLRKNNDIVILKIDKGNGVVILNRKDYNKGILDIINDVDEFKELDNDPIMSREGNLQRFLRELKRKVKLIRIFTIKFIQQVRNQHVFKAYLNYIR